MGKQSDLHFSPASFNFSHWTFLCILFIHHGLSRMITCHDLYCIHGIKMCQSFFKIRSCHSLHMSIIFYMANLWCLFSTTKTTHLCRGASQGLWCGTAPLPIQTSAAHTANGTLHGRVYDKKAIGYKAKLNKYRYMPLMYSLIQYVTIFIYLHGHMA